jgi:hypothetical protein
MVIIETLVFISLTMTATPTHLVILSSSFVSP